jgi:hypothetical protein
MIWHGDDPLHRLFPLYLLSDKLNDLVTINLMVDEKILLSGEKKLNPSLKSIELACESTAPENPLRIVCRDFIVQQSIIHQGGSELPRRCGSME